MATNQQYYGTIPGIATAYQNDPRTKLSQALIQAGGSTAPVAGNGWGVTDGLARVAQALGGAYAQKQQEKKYAGREADYTDALKQAAVLASNPQPSTPPVMQPGATNPIQPSPLPATQPNPHAAAAAALGGGMPSPSSPPVMGGPPPGAPALPPQAAQGAQMAPPGTGPAPIPQMPPQAAFPPPVDPALAGGSPMGGTGPFPGSGATPSAVPATGAGPSATLADPSAKDYYFKGIVPIEGGTGRSGKFLTSPKGAIGPGQIMPSTAPEAARLAGLPYDAARLKSDPEYNNALGIAYYDSKLKEFDGDPLKAAAAYNGGAGATRRAIRRATAAGDPSNWVNYFPKANTETPQYVKNFAAKVGNQGAAQNTGPAVTATSVPLPTMEGVPQGVQAPGNVPVAPPVAPAVQSNRVAIAQKLLSSGNPDLMALAQTYLDKGLDEQFDANKTTNAQDFQRTELGYDSGLTENRAEANDFRAQQANDRSSAQQRNFGREQTNNAQNFQAGQTANAQNFQASQSAADRAATRSNLEYSEAQNNYRTAATIAGKKETASEAQIAKRNNFLNTAAGAKMAQDTGKEVDDNNIAIGQFERFKALNQKVNTGGMQGLARATPIIGNIYNAVDPDLAEMNKIADKSTLAALGGKLGTAISDADRNFISGSNVSSRDPRVANDNIANATIAALKRKNDYNLEFFDAQANGNTPDFIKSWGAYAKAIPIVQYDSRGRAIISDSPMSFQEWRNSRPKFDSTGKRIN